ncbi:hypothetical protein [Paracoccus liaowanqingii]|uniref:hypothetical protein n=1 Tax=Paracoccus liaowanqingii TaxID=2560053 RepID=UPI00159B8AFE|nr:hypothetical protein [Paracoccus liaowanqingii]
MPKLNEAVLVRMNADLVEMLDEFRRNQPDLPSRPEAVRRIVSKVLAKKATSDGF